MRKSETQLKANNINSPFFKNELQTIQFFEKNWVTLDQTSSLNNCLKLFILLKILTFFVSFEGMGEILRKMEV